MRIVQETAVGDAKLLKISLAVEIFPAFTYPEIIVLMEIVFLLGISSNSCRACDSWPLFSNLSTWKFERQVVVSKPVLIIRASIKCEATVSSTFVRHGLIVQMKLTGSSL